MPRIAIVGSCITRDLWPSGSSEALGLLYVSRTSLPSLLAAPIAGFRPPSKPPQALRPSQHQALVADLLKTALPRLVAFRPTHLIFDFIDERFDLLSVGDSLVNLSWELEISGYLKKRALRAQRVIPRLSTGCERLWTEAAGELAELIAATPLREARLILHSARWASTSRDPDGGDRPMAGVELGAGRTADIAEHNALLARYEAIFRARMPGLEVVAAPDHRVADESHRWGLSPFHYVPDYYEAIRRQLARLGVEAPSPRSAEPSAPAA